MTKSLRFLAIISLVSFSSCAQLSLFQDAKTVGKGNMELGGLVSGYGAAGPGSGGIGIILPYAIAHGSYGVSDKVDMQLSLSMAGSLMLSPKFQIRGDKDSERAMAFNPGVEIHFGDFNNQTIVLVRTHYSFIGSTHPSEKTSIFLQTSFVHQIESGNNEFFFGGSLGFKQKLRETISLSYGCSIYGIKDASDFLYQLGIGMTFRINK